MTKRELLESYRAMVIDINLMEERLAFLGRYIGGPKPLRGVQLTGMPRGTNDPEAAILQQEDSDAALLDKIQQRLSETRRLTWQFEQILEDIADRWVRDIVQAYYGLGYSDERIGIEVVGMSQSNVNKLRNDFLRQLDENG